MIKKIAAIFCLAMYLLSMVVPRRVPKDRLAATNFVRKFLQEILYLSGTIEVVGNFIILVPLFFIFIYLFGQRKSTVSVSLCILLSASAELIQRFIPGRVNSIRDFLLNSLGAIAAFIFYQIYLKKVSLQKISK
jgi:glycopeptide antibiotics resistance protein